MKSRVRSIGVAILLVVVGIFIGQHFHAAPPVPGLPAVDPMLETQKKYAAAITKSLGEDKAIGDWVHHELVDEKKNTGDELEWALQTTKAIDLSGCPEDFRVAFTKYINAIDAFVRQWKANPRSFWGQVIVGGKNFWGGEADGGAHRIEGEDKKALEAMDTSFADVKVVAAKYNVKAP